MTPLKASGLNGRVPVPPEKRFLISLFSGTEFEKACSDHLSRTHSIQTGSNQLKIPLEYQLPVLIGAEPYPYLSSCH